jgi:hypothetical protein
MNDRALVITWTIAILFLPHALNETEDNKKHIRAAYRYFLYTVIAALAGGVILDPGFGLLLFAMGYAAIGRDLYNELFHVKPGM